MRILPISGDGVQEDKEDEGGKKGGKERVLREDMLREVKEGVDGRWLGRFTR